MTQSFNPSISTMSISTPDWVKHAIFYQIFPDRFAQSKHMRKPINLEPWDSKPTNHGFKGGDLQGIVERLDYLQDLGVNAIYLNPIFQSTANHRYHTHDYFRVDPVLGGDEAFRELLTAAHKRRIKIIIDGVFNHASRGFYFFNHALENGKDSPYIDWFHFQGFPVHAYYGHHNYDAWWGIPALPKFNTKTPAVREYLFRVAEYWIEQGVDGWRLDVPGEIDDDGFWQEFRQRVKAINPEAYIVGEIWHEAQRWLRGDQFDAVMNYQFTRACVGFFAAGHTNTHLLDNIGYAPVPELDAAGFAYALNVNLGIYHRAINEVQLNILSTHDTARFLSIAKHDVAALKLATLAQMTYPGAPCVYYGDEIGMEGGKDPDCRRSFVWDKAAWNHDLRDYVQQCVALRKKHAALRTGDFRVLFAERQTVAYYRANDREKFIVALNSAAQAAKINIITRGVLPDGVSLKTVFGEGGKGIHHTANGSLTTLEVPKRSGIVLKAN
jgi:neopullulanase